MIVQTLMNIQKAQYMCTYIQALGQLERPNSIVVGNNIEFKRLIISHAILVPLNQSLRLQICRHLLLLKIVIHLNWIKTKSPRQSVYTQIWSNQMWQLRRTALVS